MKGKKEIQHGRYSDVEYHMFDQSSTLRFLIKITKILALPFVFPFILLAKLSPKVGFRLVSELLSIIPFSLGEIIRYDFYRYTLRVCGDNVFIGFGTVFYYPEISIGSNVLIGMYNTVHHCDFGDNVLTAEGCRFLSGTRYHEFSRKDIPIIKQGGKLKRICVGSDVWIGANAIVMADIGNGSIVGAGSVVPKDIEPFSIVAGNPIKIIGKRL